MPIGTGSETSPAVNRSMRPRQCARASAGTSSRYDRREWPVVSVTCASQRATVLNSLPLQASARRAAGREGKSSIVPRAAHRRGTGDLDRSSLGIGRRAYLGLSLITRVPDSTARVAYTDG